MSVATWLTHLTDRARVGEVILEADGTRYNVMFLGEFEQDDPDASRWIIVWANGNHSGVGGPSYPFDLKFDVPELTYLMDKLNVRSDVDGRNLLAAIREFRSEASKVKGWIA